MSAQPFHDLREADFKRFDRANEERARLAVLRNATASDDALDHAATLEDSGDETQDATHDAVRVKRLLGDFAHTTDALSLFLAGTGVRCPPQFRQFIDVVVGIAGDRTDWFGVTDEVVSRHAGRSKKWVQIQRKEFLEWETKHKKTFIEIQDSYTDANMKHHSHKYKVNIGTCAANIKLDAQHLPEWKINPGKALETASRNFRHSLPDTPPHTSSRRTATPSETELMHRQISRARTHLANATNLQPLDGSLAWVDGGLVAEIESLLAEIKRIGGISSVQTSTIQSIKTVEVCRPKAPTQDTLRMEVEPAETDQLHRVEKSSTCENIDPNADFEVFEVVFDDEPPVELTYEFEPDDPPTADEIAEAEAIRDEANGKSLEPDELSAPSPTVAASPLDDVRPLTDEPRHEPSARAGNSPEIHRKSTEILTEFDDPSPLDLGDEAAAYQFFEASIAKRAAELMRTRGMKEREADRAAWNDHGHFYAWLAEQRARRQEVSV